ncbi:MAG: protein TolR [Acidobacteria bacterium]|nr:MAG: protein TolR [Acidobacteriota bacterium]PYR76912.1 MAG: protein TolR [Acidobacteriota bacterium]
MPKVQATGTNGNGRRRGRGVRVATSLAEINVVPLVDVMLVLLIIFMVTAPMMTQGMQVNLPQSSRARGVNAQPIYVTIPAEFAKTRIVQINNDEVRVDILQERMKQLMLERDDKSVFMRADAGVTVQDLATVWDKLIEAGIEKIGMATRPVAR